MPPVRQAQDKHIAVYVRFGQDTVDQVQELNAWLGLHVDTPAIWYEDSFIGNKLILADPNHEPAPTVDDYGMVLIDPETGRPVQQ